MEYRVLRVIQLLGSIAAFVLSLSCQRNVAIEKQDCGEMSFSKTINLDFDTLQCSQIIDFYPVGESSYVLTDGACIYKTDSTGAVVSMINKQGHGKEEYIKIGKLYSDGHYIYAWCGMSLQLYKYDMDLNFLDKYQGPNHAMTKFVVADNDTAYFLLSGGFDEVIGTLPLDHNGTPSFSGCYTNEDKALLLNSASGGIAVYDHQIKYVKPSEMKIWTVGNTDTWNYEDRDFTILPAISDLNSLTEEETLGYILSGSTCSGLYADGEDLWLVTETGFFELKEDGQLSSDKRFLNLCKINKDGEILSSYKYNYPQGFYLIYNKCLHVLSNVGNYYEIKHLKL